MFVLSTGIFDIIGNDLAAGSVRTGSLELVSTWFVLFGRVFVSPLLVCLIRNPSMDTSSSVSKFTFDAVFVDKQLRICCDIVEDSFDVSPTLGRRPVDILAFVWPLLLLITVFALSVVCLCNSTYDSSSQTSDKLVPSESPNTFDTNCWFSTWQARELRLRNT